MVIIDCNELFKIQVQLFVELLNKYIYFLDNGCTDVSLKQKFVHF